MGQKIFTGLLLFASLLCWIEAAQYYALIMIGKETRAFVSFSERKISESNNYSNYYQFHTDDGSLFTGKFTAEKEFKYVKIRYLEAYPRVNSPGTFWVLAFYAAAWFLAGCIIIWLRLNWLIKNKNLNKDEDKWLKLKETENTLSGEWAVPMITLAAGMSIWLFFISDVDWLGIRKMPEIVSGRLGNTEGNLANEGSIAAEGQWLYMQDPSKSGIYRMKHDLTERKKLTNDESFYINVLDGWLYYCNFYENMNIYRISADGRKRKKLVSRRAEDLHVMGDWLFFINTNDHDKIYRAEKNGSSLTKLNNDPSENINLSGEWIYYISEKAFSAGKIYRIKNNGQAREKISEEPVMSILVHGDWIYYIHDKDGKKIYRMKTDGTEKIRINDSPSYFMNIADSRIFYINNNDGYIWNIPLEGGTPAGLNEEDSSFIHIAGDMIYYRIDFPSQNSGQFIRTSIKGGREKDFIKF